MNYLINTDTKTVIEIDGKDVTQIHDEIIKNGENLGKFTLKSLLDGNLDNAGPFEIGDIEDVREAGIHFSETKTVSSSEVTTTEETVTSQITPVIESDDTVTTHLDDVSTNTLVSSETTTDTPVIDHGQETTDTTSAGEGENVLTEVSEIEDVSKNHLVPENQGDNQPTVTEGKTNAADAVKKTLGVNINAEGLGKLGDNTVNETKRVYTAREISIMKIREVDHENIIGQFEAAGTYLNYVVTSKEGDKVRWYEFNLSDKNTEDCPISRKNPNLFVSPTKKGLSITLYLNGRSSGQRHKIIFTQNTDIAAEVKQFVEKMISEGHLQA